MYKTPLGCRHSEKNGFVPRHFRCNFQVPTFSLLLLLLLLLLLWCTCFLLFSVLSFCLHQISFEQYTDPSDKYIPHAEYSTSLAERQRKKVHTCASAFGMLGQSRGTRSIRSTEFFFGKISQPFQAFIQGKNIPFFTSLVLGALVDTSY